ncbi:2-isopropylmalate synthase [Pelomyxa schiedti]|nr:2-isopropylmalate synthase [Pelomyxa schiedti]
MAATTSGVEMVVGKTMLCGTTYTGRLVNSKRDGTGTCTWEGGNTYTGEWRDNKKHGRGAQRWGDGSTYEGEWRNGKREGWGVGHYAKESGEREASWYEGLWRDERWKRGTWHTCNTGDVYEGEWVWNDTKWMGSAEEARRGLARNTGDGFDHGKKSGNGRMLFGDSHAGGGSYVGEWKDDKFHGRGVRLWANGDRYEGQWVCGKENGEGTKVLACDGSSFTGLWEMGVAKKGTRRWPNGDMFEGTFTSGGGCGGLELRGEGVSTLPSSEGCNMVQLRGILNSNNMFQQHKMGSPPFEIIEALNADKKQLQLRIEQLTKEIEVCVDNVIFFLF